MPRLGVRMLALHWHLARYIAHHSKSSYRELNLGMQSNAIASGTAFTVVSPSTPITTFTRSDKTTLVSVGEAWGPTEHSINKAKLFTRMNEIRPLVQNNVTGNRKHAWEQASKDHPANILECDYFLIARHEYFKDEKLCVRWRGSCCIIKTYNYYVFDVEEIHSGSIDSIHGSRLNYYRDSSLHKKIIMLHMVYIEMVMPVATMMRLVRVNDDFKVLVREMGLSLQEYRLKPFRNRFEYVPQISYRLLMRKIALVALSQETRDSLDV